MTGAIRNLGVAAGLLAVLASSAFAATPTASSPTTGTTPHGRDTRATPGATNSRYLPSNATTPQGTVATGDGRLAPAEAASGGVVGGSGGGNGH